MKAWKSIKKSLFFLYTFFFVPKTKHLGKTKLNLNLYQQQEGSCGKVKASTEGRHKVPQETLGRELLYLSDTLYKRKKKYKAVKN